MNYYDSLDLGYESVNKELENHLQYTRQSYLVRNIDEIQDYCIKNQIPFIKEILVEYPLHKDTYVPYYHEHTELTTDSYYYNSNNKKERVYIIGLKTLIQEAYWNGYRVGSGIATDN